jgi:hypothetical protein
MHAADAARVCARAHSHVCNWGREGERSVCGATNTIGRSDQQHGRRSVDRDKLVEDGSKAVGSSCVSTLGDRKVRY